MGANMMRALAVAVALALAHQAQAADLVIGTYNIESGGADHHKVVARVRGAPKADIWVFQEVPDKFWINKIQDALEEEHGTEYRGKASLSGVNTYVEFADDRLAVIYDNNTVKHNETVELTEEVIDRCGERRFRAPMVSKFTRRATGKRFRVVNVHLQRDEDYNTCQAELLVSWSRHKTLPMIATGDFNFDMSVSNKDNRRLGFDRMVGSGVFAWIEPQNFQKSYCERNSYLDFVFLSGSADHWTVQSEILFTGSDSYCGDAEESDHRPVLARVTIQ
jgi:endonuclease/exonuclease/phosphatase family metal-dependent hydrolase